jgi:hypothetical protein
LSIAIGWGVYCGFCLEAIGQLVTSEGSFMTSSFSRPVLVPPEGDAVVLERVPLKGADSSDEYSEVWLQDLLYRFPQALPISEIDDGFSGLIPLCKEMMTPAGPIDVVYITPNGRPVIVEAKLWRNPEARRKVIGQILDYAKELSRWSYESFDAAVRAARRQEDGSQSQKSLFDLARRSVPDLDEARFFDSVSQSLRRGDLLLLIVGDGIREGVGAITQFLEGHGTLHFTFGLVEMAISRMPDGGRLVQPRVMAQSTIIRRIVFQVDKTGLSLNEVSEADSEMEIDNVSEELTQIREKYIQFWTEFLQKINLDDKSQPISKPSRSTNQYFTMPSPAAWVSAYLAQSSGKIGVYLTFAKGPIGDRLYKILEGDKESVNDALGVPVSWESDGAKHWIIDREFFTGVLIEEHRSQIHSWFIDRVNRFINVFRPRIERAVRESESAPAT